MSALKRESRHASCRSWASGWNVSRRQGSGENGAFRRSRQWRCSLFAYSQSRKVLLSFRPDLVLGVGGYASGPVVLAARGMQIRRFIHEQNAIPGVTNKILAWIVEQIFISLAESEKFFPKDKSLLTGNPVRREIVAEAADAARIEREGMDGGASLPDTGVRRQRRSPQRQPGSGRGTSFPGGAARTNCHHPSDRCQ